jgi:hypothetical protein
VAAIRLLDGVADAGIDRDGTNIWIDYRSGVGGGLYLVSPDLLGAGAQPSVSVSALRVEDATATSSLPAVSGQSFDITAVPPGIYVGNNKVLIWNAGEFAADQAISGLFKKSKCPAFDVTVLYGEQCTVDSIAAFVGYGTILILAHGNNVDTAPAEGHRLPGVSFLTGEDAGENSLWNKAKEYVNLYRSKYTKYSADLKTGRLMVYTGLRLPKKKNYFIAKWDYISNLPGMFPNSILFAGSCFSRSDQTMANAFLERGAKAYFGFSAKAYVLHIYDAARQLFDSLIESGKNVSETYASMPKEYVPLPDGPVPPPEATGCKFQYSEEYGAANLQYNRDCSMMGTFDRHEVTVVWFGSWMAGSGIREAEVDKENKTPVPLL